MGYAWDKTLNLLLGWDGGFKSKFASHPNDIERALAAIDDAKEKGISSSEFITKASEILHTQNLSPDAIYGQMCGVREFCRKHF